MFDLAMACIQVVGVEACYHVCCNAGMLGLSMLTVSGGGDAVTLSSFLLRAAKRRASGLS